MVLSPALGGIVIGHEVARALGVRAMFAERQDGALMLRRGFMLAETDRVLVVEDVAHDRRIDARDDAGGAGGGRTRRRRRVDRRSQRRPRSLRRAVSIAGLASTLPTYEPEPARLCAQGLPVVKPGSRPGRVSRTFKLTLAYDGTDFVGWQRQASGVSIQGLLEDALSELDGRAVTVTGAGRTDAGVHARGQVASVGARTRRSTPRRVVRAVNIAPAGFGPHPRRVAVPATTSTRASTRDSKTYRYRIWNAEVMSPFERSYAWHVPMALDVAAMADAAARARAARTTSRRFKGPAATRRRPSATVMRSSVERDAGSPLDRLRSRRRRFPPAHGPEHRRHAGRGRARAMSRRLDGRRARLARSRGSRSDRPGAGPVSDGGRLRRVATGRSRAPSSVG